MSRIKDTRCFDPLIYSPLNHLLRFLYNENDTDTIGPKMPVPLSSFHVLSVGANTRYNFVRGVSYEWRVGCLYWCIQCGAAYPRVCLRPKDYKTSYRCEREGQSRDVVRRATKTRASVCN